MQQTHGCLPFYSTGASGKGDSIHFEEKTRSQATLHKWIAFKNDKEFLWSDIYSIGSSSLKMVKGFYGKNDFFRLGLGFAQKDARLLSFCLNIKGSVLVLITLPCLILQDGRTEKYPFSTPIHVVLRNGHWGAAPSPSLYGWIRFRSCNVNNFLHFYPNHPNAMSYTFANSNGNIFLNIEVLSS